MEKSEDCIRIVDELNAVLEGCNGPRFVYTTDASMQRITIGDMELWNDDEDMRDYDETKNEYEPLKSYLIKQLESELEDLQQIVNELKGIEDAAS